MTVYISLLRGINVGGSKILSMDALCDLYSGLGFTHVRTYLQSGNVVFISTLEDHAELASQIEKRIEQAFGFRVIVFICQAEDFQRVIANNPFIEQAKRDPSRLHISFLRRPPAEEAWNKLEIPPNIPDQFSRGAKVIYLYFPLGSAKAKISTSYLEKVLEVPITDRNWNTVNALYRIAKEI
jgi:uncharacterized protein (DUF1697 family)